MGSKGLGIKTQGRRVDTALHRRQGQMIFSRAKCAFRWWWWWSLSSSWASSSLYIHHFFSSSCLCSKIIFRDYVVLHGFFIFFQENSTSSLGLKVDIITHTDLCCTLGNSDWSPPLKQKWKASVSKVICLYIYIYTYICFVFRKLGSEVIVTFGLNTPSKNDFKIC